MFQVFELIMTGVLAYMAYTVIGGYASPVVLGILLMVQAVFWTLDFLFIRSVDSKSSLSFHVNTLESSFSRG